MNHEFEHAMIMAGGGSRFGYYLGMYAAFVEAGKNPDVIFATCGGSVAAGIISAFDSTIEQKEALMSHEIHQMFARIQSNNNQSIFRVLSGVCRRYLNQQAIDIFPDLNSAALFDITENDKALFPFSPLYSSNATEFGIVGSSLCFSPTHVRTKRINSPLFEEVVFGSKRLTQSLTNCLFTPQTPLIKDKINTETRVSFQEAIRVSLSDIYYLTPHKIKEKYYMGGMLDLTPFGLASQCAYAITLERKQAFSNMTAVPAFMKLLGFNPNKKQAEIPTRHQDIWVDTSDSPKVLKHSQINKQIQWYANRVKIKMPTYDSFIQMMQAQWSYGYQRGLHALGQLPERRCK